MVQAYRGKGNGLRENRRYVRSVMDSLQFEVLVIILVLVYALIIFIDLAVVTDSVQGDDSNSTAVMSDNSLRDAFRILDLIFLPVFVAELFFRLLGEGVAFLHTTINAVDAVVVVLSLVVVALQDSCRGCRVLQLLRIIRLFRFAVIIGKLQRSRDAATMRRKRAMYRRLGAPVEKVLEFFTDFQQRLDNKKDQENVRWMMEVIAADDLYSVGGFDEYTLRNLQGLNAQLGTTNDMGRWLSSETGLNKREEDSKADGGVAADVADDGSLHQRRDRINSLSSISQDLWVRDALKSCFSQRLQNLLSPNAWSFDMFAFDKLCHSVAGPAHGKSATVLCYFLLEEVSVRTYFRSEMSDYICTSTAWSD